MDHFIERRRIIMAAGGGALALSLGAFGEDDEEGATTANEDLMREHGITYAEMGDKFEEIERRTFGHDGFDDAHTRIARIEVSFALKNLAEVTAPPPPPA